MNSVWNLFLRKIKNRSELELWENSINKAFRWFIISKFSKIIHVMRTKNVKKLQKAHFLKLQVRQAISQTLLETSSLAYSTRYNQYLMILHYRWHRVRRKLFSKAKKCEKLKKLIFWNSEFNKRFLIPIS